MVDDLGFGSELKRVSFDSQRGGWRPALGMLFYRPGQVRLAENEKAQMETARLHRD